jgi:iron complex outermembrane receptor protein
MILKKLLNITIPLALALSFTVSAADEDGVEEVVVTGSYIKGSPTDGASPVEIYSRSAIDDMGAITVADITANIAVNSGSENNADSFTSGATQGLTNVNLRGLGLSSTLVLIDGRRQTVTGATANDGSVFVNTSSIPTIALERVEVLKEGAASIYGSDAVAGVVNYIFRRDFTGFEVEASTQQTDLGSSKDNRTGLIYGAESGETNFVIAMSNLDRSPLRGSDFSPSLAPLGISGLGNSFLLFGPSTVASGPYAGTYTAFQNVPDANCVANNGIIIPQGSGERCGFLYGDRFNLVNDEKHQSVYLSVKTEMANGTTFDLDILNSQTNVYDNPQSPSYPALSYLSTSNLIMPGKGGNPFGVPLMWLGRALGSAFPSPNAPREIETDRVSAGFTGTFENGNDWDLHYTVSNEASYGSQPDTRTSRFSSAINGSGGNSGNETWDLFDSSANSQALRDWIRTDQKTWVDVELSVLDFVTSGQTDNLSYALGFQSRNEKLDIERNDISIVEFDAAGNLTKPADMIFLGGGLETSTSRDSTAIFGELSSDLSDQLSIKAALRYEDLETGSTVDPKVSFRYQATDDLILRASLSTSFREASLAQLNSSGVGLQGIQDYNADGTAKGGTVFIRIATVNNVALEPEESDNMNMGLIWYPSDELEMKLDYWTIDYTNVITIENAQGLVRLTPFADAVKRTEGGTLVGVTTSYFNAAQVDTNGIDFEANYGVDTDLGQLSLGVNLTHIMQYEIPYAGTQRDVVGMFNHDNFARSLPETKMVLSASLDSGDHAFAAYARFVSDYETDRAVSATAANMGFDQNIDSFLTLDLQYAYRFNFGDNDMKFTLGVKNALDEEAPMVYDAANWSYDPKHHDARGRMISVGLKLMR